ncbi:MAG: Ig-like domain repeat protein [Candidatus Wallbacteria bacterium]|nr:Ig-like domain repeat protein [Candidatus Wallbacteria bacterium]
MQTARKAPRSRALWLLLVWMLVAGVTPAGAQCLPGEAAGSVKITQPQAFQQAQPFRTNRSQINIGFEHDGNSGSYLIKTDGADVNGSTFLPLPTDKQGNVLAGFNTDGVKQIGVVLLQQKCNLVVDSRQTGGQNGTAFIQFDSKPPVITLQSVTLGANPPNTPTPFNNQTFITKEDQVTIVGTAVDPDNGSPAADIKITLKNTSNNQSQTLQLDAASGTFTANVSLAGINDGDINIEIVAEDKMTDSTTTPNKSAATVIKFVRDKTAPKVQQLEIIRFDGDANRRQVLSPGAKSFVGQEIVFLRVTMSEKMASPPQVQVTQNAGSRIPATILTDRTVNDTVFTFQYNVIPVEAQNGPARVEITGAFDGNGPLPDFGFDLANNPIAQNDASATFAQAFSVDTVSPDLNRLPQPPPPGQFVSVPKDGEVVGKDAFPKTIQVFVDDFNTAVGPDATKTFASGVDFSNVSNAATGTASGSGLTISVRGPAGDLPGTPSVSPPTGLFLNLPDFTGSANSNANFTDRDGDGVKEPLDGAYSITVNLVDKVGNRSTKTINFRVDTVPVSAESIAVHVAGCISLQTREFPAVVVSSRDADFNVTATNVEFFSQIGGPNSVPVKFDTDAPNRAAATTPGTSATITLNNIRKPGQPVATDQFPFPVPAAPTEFVPPGTIDPRTGANDGTYFVRVTPKDNAGNIGTVSTTSSRRQAFLDFPVQIDNTDPFVERTFPVVNQAIAGPINFFETVVVDPVATNGNAGCGIDVNATNMVARIEAAYQPNRVPSSFVDTPGQFPSKLRGTLKFIHIPNSLDPTRNDFNPKDDRFRVALEFTDPVTGRSRTLPTDGSMDGIYSIAVNPVDRAGNSLDINPLSPARLGQYFGLKPDAESTINLAQFFFLIDNIPPDVEVDNFPDGALLAGQPGRLKDALGKTATSVAAAVGATGVVAGPVIGARPFRITGVAIDKSAQLGAQVGGQNDPFKGGADIDRVEYFLEVVNAQGPVAGEPPQQNQQTGEITPGKLNPIIPVTRAILDPVQITDPPPGNDATRTTSRSMDSGFAGSVRERRKFTIDDILPSEDRLLKPKNLDEFYRFTIRAIDRAGNVTSIARRVTVDINDVKPPALIEPADNTFSKTPILKFKWGNVSGIRKFRWKISPPPGSSLKPFERIINKAPEDVNNLERNVVQITLPEEGLWKWSVSSFDQVGNEGVASNEFRVTVDLTRPTINGDKATVTGDVQPTNRSGVIGIGTFNVRLEFSERLKTAPFVSWQPASASTGAILLTTAGFTGSVYEAQGTIPRDADPRVFDGRASLVVNNVNDLAGNPINGQNQVTIDGFEVDTGPAFQARFFISPLTPSEMTLVVLASEELQQTPRFSELVGLAQVTNDSFRVATNPRAFYTTLKILQPNIDQVAKASISGTDLEGNVSRRDLRLSVTRLRKNIAIRLKAADSDFTLDVPEGAVKNDTTAYVFPAHDGFGAAGAEPAGLSKASTEPSTPPADAGMIDLGPLPELAPAGLELDALATLRMTMPQVRGVDPRRAGVYQLEGGRWRWVGGQSSGNRVVGRIRQFAPLRLMADVRAPQILEVTPSDGEPLETGRPTITAKLTDTGSGVANEGIALALDGATVNSFQYDEASGLVTFTPERDLAPGPHAVELTVSDRAGNATPVQKIGLVAPDQFGFAEPVLAVPNPARSATGGFALALTQPAVTATVRVEIFDAAGDRVRTLAADGPFAGARQAIAWDLADEDGSPVQNGVYLFRARATSVTGSKAQSRGKLAVLR